MVMVSYSSKDRETVERLKINFAPVVNQDTVQFWEDSDIEKGEEWRKAIAAAIDDAAIAVLLVSANFFASSYVCNDELPQILRRQREGKLKVLSVFLARSLVDDIDISVTDSKTGATYPVKLDSLQGFGAPDKPLSEMTPPECDRVFVALARKVRDLSLAAQAGGTPPRSSVPHDDGSSPQRPSPPESPTDPKRPRDRWRWWMWGTPVAVAILALCVWGANYFLREVRCETAIETPEAGATVGAGGMVTGTARVPSGGHIWILLHPPIPGNQWFPQEPVSLRADDGTWSALVYYGTQDDIGREFEIAAVVVTSSTSAAFEGWLRSGRTTNSYTPLTYPIGTERVSGCSDARRVVRKGSH
jgi:hypothetical protein